MNHFRVLEANNEPINPPKAPMNPIMRTAIAMSRGVFVKPRNHSDMTKTIL